ncbi:MAG TPA: hypothetical protein DCE44_08780, partial [Verrucomicrobiales bacterium]|nr:hypothetical protein [Verrucomicrobiales bacterium]
NGQEDSQAAQTAAPVGAAIAPNGGVPSEEWLGPGAGLAGPAESNVAAGAIVSLKKFLRDNEASYLRQVLSRTNQNKEEAARLLDVSLATLYRKLAEDSE